MAEGTSSVDAAVLVVAERLRAGTPFPPARLEEIAGKSSVCEIRYSDACFGAGELHAVNGGFLIVCSSKQPKVRQRWTIAHELAHVVMESGSIRSQRGGDDLERICDMLAAEILMPRALFTERAKSCRSLSGLLKLRDLFETSIEATARRFHELFDLSTFGVENDELSWGAGLIRPDGPLGVDDISPCLNQFTQVSRHGIERVLVGQGMRSRQYLLEWRSLGERTLFQLTRWGGGARELKELKTAFEKASGLTTCASAEVEREFLF